MNDSEGDESDDINVEVAVCNRAIGLRIEALDDRPCFVGHYVAVVCGFARLGSSSH